LEELFDEIVKYQYPKDECKSKSDDEFDVHRVMDHGFSSILIAPVNFLMWYFIHYLLLSFLEKINKKKKK